MRKSSIRKRSNDDKVSGRQSSLFNDSKKSNTNVEPSAPPISETDPNNDSTLSEYTPLLENFTERFINRSQGPVLPGFIDSNQSSTMTAQSSQQQQSITVIQPSVPPELLLIHYQQSPFNPNLVPSDVSSMSSFGDVNLDNNNQNESTASNIEWSSGCWQKFRLHLCQSFWYLSQTILIIGLIVFNFGSTFSPSIYSSLVIMPNIFNANDKHPKMVVLDFFALTTFQLTMSILSLIGSLILLYSASRVIHRLRRRVHLRKLKQMSSNPNSVQSTSNNKIYESESTTTIMTYETIIFETLGSTMARIFSSIMLIHQFCLCSLYVHLIFDYFDLLISSLSTEWIDYLDLNGERQWYLNHFVLGSIWLTSIVTVIVLSSTTMYVWSLQSRQTWRTFQYTKLFLLWIIKIFSILIGFVTLTITLFVGIHIYLHQDVAINKFNITEITDGNNDPANDVPLLHIKMNDWCKSLFGAIPFLLMPFHLNEILVMLMYSRYDHEYYRQRLLTIDNDNDVSDNSVRNATNANDNQQQSQQIMNYQSIRNSSASSTINPHRTEESKDPLLYLASIQSMKRSVRSSFFFRTFSTIRNWFIMVIFFTLLFQIIMNILYFHLIDTKITEPNATSIIELNFIRQYLVNQEKPYVMIASIVLLLNTTIIYLIMLFRGKISQDWLIYGQKQPQQSLTNEKRFDFWTPFILWNCLILINGIIIENTSRILQLQLWLIGLTTMIILLLCPSLLLIYFACKTLRTSTTSNNNLMNNHESLYQRFYPLKWPWLFLFISLFIFSTTFTYVIFWIYGYWYDDKDFGYIMRIKHH